MITLTKEWLLKTISELEEERDSVPGAVNEDAANALAAMKLALASLEAVPVGTFKKGPCGYHPSFHEDAVPLFTAPPAPVALPSGYSDFEEIWSSSTHPLTQDDEMKDFAWDIWNACRAAMLQGADGALTNEDTKKMDELVMWIKRLAHSLRKASPDSKLQSDAMDYLSRKGLIGVKDILR